MQEGDNKTCGRRMSEILSRNKTLCNQNIREKSVLKEELARTKDHLIKTLEKTIFQLVTKNNNVFVQNPIEEEI